MIGKLKGSLVELDGNVGLIETSGGVYYQVFLLPGMLVSLTLPTPIEVYTYLQVREDALILFGFRDKAEVEFFKMLLSVSGVGPKSAYAVISHSPISVLVDGIRQNDAEAFTKFPGLGKKTAMKIILELSGKLKSDFAFESLYMSDDDQTAIDALVSLGFKAQDAKKILSKLPKTLTLEQKIQEGIKLGMKPKQS